jgi:hypothetical protein
MNRLPLLSRGAWRSLAKILKGAFVCVFAASFIGGTLLEIYYPGHRPHVPQPNIGQTVKLPWTNPVSFGSSDDAGLMYGIFWLGMYSWALFGLSLAIRVYILDEHVPIRGEPQRFGRLTRTPPDDSK